MGGPRDVATYVLIANTSPNQGNVKVTLLFDGGGTVEKTFEVKGHSRFNVDARAEFPDAIGKRFGVLVESQLRSGANCTYLGTMWGVDCSPVPIVVERAMYWNALGQWWAAGTNSLATRVY